MSRELIESIINRDYVSANDLFEERLSIIREQKLYEEKRRMSAKLDEIFGGMSKKEIEDRRKAGYRRASEVLGDPTATKLSPAAKKYRASLKKKKVSEETLDEAGLGDAARIVHSMTGGEKKLFKSATAGNMADALKLRASMKNKKLAATSSDYKRPGIIKRNINTLMGRDPGYVDTRSEKQKEMEKGGRVGKFVRGGYGLLGRVLSQAQSGTLE